MPLPIELQSLTLEERNKILLQAADLLEDKGADIAYRIRSIVEASDPALPNVDAVHQVNAGDSGSGKDK